METGAIEDSTEKTDIPWTVRTAHALCVAVLKLGYKVRVAGAENLPTRGGALIAPNHVSYPDALFIMEAAQKPVRFVMDRDIYGWPGLNSLCRMLRVIPVSEKDGRSDIAGFVTASKKALADGELLCIFPEGMVTRDGCLNRFRSGYTWITRDMDVPVIPAKIEGAWGSTLSHAYGKLLARFPSPFRRDITVTFGAPLPSCVSPVELRAAVEAL